jgi:cytochrome b pre-mRNA-processing protein 3
MSIWPFKRNQANSDAEQLLAEIVSASRQPAFFGVRKVSDTLEGRFELLTLFAALALIRLRASPEAAPLAQAFTDQLFRHLDSGLREAGVGDLTVPKRMRRLAGDFYGRLDAYAAALQDRQALAAAIARNILGEGADPAFAAFLADHARALAARLAEQPVSAMARSGVWQGPIG